MLQQAQHRDHPVNRAEQRLWRLHAARGVKLPQWQQIQREVEDGLGIAPDMAAIA